MGPDRTNRPIVVVMGVSGAGKSTIGRALADRWNVDFVEGDRLHPPENVARMAAGIPLDDEARQPWLDAVGSEISSRTRHGVGAVISCSALKRRYRDQLRAAGAVRFVHLSLDAGELGRRVDHRDHEFMPPALLGAQLGELEAPVDEPDAVTVEPAERIDDTVDRVITALGM